MIIIGDLHGDYYKLKRILQENQIIKFPNNNFSDGLFIEEELKNIEIIDKEEHLVFVGDYIDWRGEPIENPFEYKYSQLVKGTKGIIKLISWLIKNRGNIFTLLGNHEQMMFKGLEILNKMEEQEFDILLERISQNAYSVVKELSEKNLLEDFFSFYNWYSQGGINTIKAFENIWNLKKAIEEEELFKNLLVFIYFQDDEEKKIFISHSFPDDLTCIDRMLEDKLNENDILLILWSRKIWGIDAFNARKTEPLKNEEIINILNKHKIEKYIVGHTRISLNDGPSEFLDGKIINVDNHGIPFSKPLIIRNFKFVSYKFRIF